MTQRFAEIIKKSITKEDMIIGNLKSQFTRSTLQAQRQISVSPAQANGNIALAYYRGLNVGEEDRTKEIISALKKKFPKASEFIKNKYCKP